MERAQTSQVHSRSSGAHETSARERHGQSMLLKIDPVLDLQPCSLLAVCCPCSTRETEGNAPQRTIGSCAELALQRREDHRRHVARPVTSVEDDLLHQRGHIDVVG